jgi:hypothetical protein
VGGFKTPFLQTTRSWLAFGDDAAENFLLGVLEFLRKGVAVGRSSLSLFLFLWGHSVLVGSLVLFTGSWQMAICFG